MIRLGIDLDGGDFKAEQNIGAVLKYAKKNKDVEIYAFSKDQLQNIPSLKNLTIVKCEDYINENDSILALRKKSKAAMVQLLII